MTNQILYFDQLEVGDLICYEDLQNPFWSLIVSKSQSQIKILDLEELGTWIKALWLAGKRIELEHHYVLNVVRAGKVIFECQT